MAANLELAGDIEGAYGGNRVQPFATPMQEQRLMDEEKKQNPTTLKKILGFQEIFFCRSVESING